MLSIGSYVDILNEPGYVESKPALFRESNLTPTPLAFFDPRRLKSSLQLIHGLLPR